MRKNSKRKKRPSHRRRTRFVFLLVFLLAVSGLLYYAIQPEHFREWKDDFSAWCYRHSEAAKMGYNAKAMLLTDRSDNSVFAEKQKTEKQSPASLAKLFTIEYARTIATPDTRITVEEKPLLHVKEGSSLAHLQAGETYTLRDLFAAMLVPSGNDAAYVVADYIGGLRHPDASTSDERIRLFLEDLRTHLQENGWTDTRLFDPSGYDFEGSTTAVDLQQVCEILLKEPWFREIVSQSTYVATLADGTTKSWKNTNRFLDPNDSYYNENVKGVKTGSLAGDYNLIVLYHTGGKEFLIVSLGSSSDNSRYDDLSYLLKTIEESDYLKK